MEVPALRSWPLTRDEARALLDACGTARLGVRNRAALVLFYRGGLRCAEACAVGVHELAPHGAGWRVHVSRPKGIGRRATPRDVGVDEKHGAALGAWLELRGRGAGPFLVSGRGAELDPSYFRRLVPALAARAGIERRVHPHAFRHTFARELWEERKDLLTISRALGHRSLKTTAVYLESIGCFDVLDRLIDRET